MKHLPEEDIFHWNAAREESYETLRAGHREIIKGYRTVAADFIPEMHAEKTDRL